MGEVSLKNKRRDDIVYNIFGRLFEIVQMSSKNNCSVHVTCMTQQPHSDVYIVKIYKFIEVLQSYRKYCSLFSLREVGWL